MNNNTTNLAPMTRAHLASLIGKTEAELDGPTPFEQQSAIQAVIVWATKAAIQHVDLAHHNGEPVDNTVGEGLWQSFRAEFPRADHDALGVSQMAITVLGQTFRSMVDVMDAKARQVATVGATVEGLGPLKLDV